MITTANRRRRMLLATAGAVVGMSAAVSLVAPPASLAAAAGRLVYPPRAGQVRACAVPVRPGVQRYAPDVAGSAKTVALTFDDGPGRSTAQDLAVLRRYGVTASFFNLGSNEARDPSTVRAEASAGYAMGDHTWDHQDLTMLSASGQRGEMTSERSIQSQLTGAAACLFRPPYGSSNATTVAVANSLGMTVWDWSVDTEDWKAQGSADSYWVNRIISRAEAGGSLTHPVILFHNQPGGNPATVAALPAIIHYYLARGYRFVDLLGFTGPPAVSRLTPVAVGLSGGNVTVRGLGFDGLVEVLVAGRPAPWVRLLSSTQLVVPLGARAAGKVSVVVVTSHGSSRPAQVAMIHAVPAPQSKPTPTS